MFLIVGVVVIGVQIRNGLDSGVLRVDFLDVGQGDATLITTPTGKQLLIDTGINQIILRALGEVMPVSDSYIDAVLLTHPDADHIGGTVHVLNTFDVGMVLVASSSRDTDITRSIDEALTQRGTPRRILRRGDTILLDPLSNVLLEVLAPGDNVEQLDTNDQSLVLKVTYGTTCMIFTGDASITIEEEIVVYFSDIINCNVLKAGHHGSKTSTGELFVGYVSPQYAVISAGRDNAFGHPHQEVLDILERFNVSILETNKQGTITLLSDGETVYRQ